MHFPHYIAFSERESTSPYVFLIFPCYLVATIETTLLQLGGIGSDVVICPRYLVHFLC
jgi:hypothetical protein